MNDDAIYRNCWILHICCEALYLIWLFILFSLTQVTGTPKVLKWNYKTLKLGFIVFLLQKSQINEVNKSHNNEVNMFFYIVKNW